MIGMRSEDLHRCAAFIDLPNVINGSVFLTRRLDEAEIISAIVEPMRLSLRLRGSCPSGTMRSDRPLAVRRRRPAPPQPGDSCDGKRSGSSPAAAAPAIGSLEISRRDRSCRLPWARHLNTVRASASPAMTLLMPSTLSSASRDGRIFPNQLCKAARAQVDRELDPPACAGSRRRRASCPSEQAASGDHREDAQLNSPVDDRGNYKRRWTSRHEILESVRGHATPAEIDIIVAAFSSPYPFLNARPGLNGKIDVSHESFIRSWTQFASG